MNVRIVKPGTILYEGSAKIVQLPGSDGLFEIMENHAPIISSLSKGKIRLVLEDNTEQCFEIKAGVVRSQQNDMLVLVQ